MIFRKYIHNSNALQVVNLLRFFTYFLISILLAKTGYSKTQIGKFEIIILIANAVSFFWVYGIINSLMSLYNNNDSYSDITRNRKSPELFNAFLLLSSLSTLVILIFFAFKSQLNYIWEDVGNFPYFTIVILFIFFSNPSNLIEYIYILRNKPIRTFFYGVFTYTIILISVSVPLILKLEIKIALWCLLGTSIFRYIWLIILLKRYAELKLSFRYIKEHLKLAYPLILSYLLSGSAEYIDNLIISLKFDLESLATFRYGAKELPFTTSMANGLSSSLMAEFSTQEKIQKSISLVKVKSKRLMHILFPISIIILLLADVLYPLVFRSDFSRSADVFMVYLLLITSRLLFPHTILIGLKQTKIVFRASLVAIILNIVLSLFLIQYYGIIGVALATIFVYGVEKVILMWLVYKRFGIKPSDYTPISTYLIYCSILTIIFVLIDHRIIIL